MGKGAYFCLSIQTTGLDPSRHKPVELGFCVLDGLFNPMRDPVVCFLETKGERGGWDHWEPGAFELHTKNGLIEEYSDAHKYMPDVVDDAMAQTIKQHTTGRLVLLCNSPHFIRQWLPFFPKTDALLRPDAFDVSSVRKLVLSARNLPSDSGLKQTLGYGSYRAAKDVDILIEESQCYFELFRTVP